MQPFKELKIWNCYSVQLFKTVAIEYFENIKKPNIIVSELYSVLNS